MAPRYSLVPGDFVDDQRPTLAHYRVLLALGRRTNKAGWCMVSQTKLAAHMGISRQTINSAIADLVKWGYVEKRGQEMTKRAICHYRVLLDRAIPEIDTDDGVMPEGESHAGDADLEGVEGDVSPTDDTPHLSPGADTYVSPTDDTRVASDPTRGVASDPTPVTIPGRTTPLPQRKPPLALAARREGEAGIETHGWAKGWDTAARNAVYDLLGSEAEHVGTALLIPLVGTLNPPAGVHGASFVRDLADLQRWPADVLEALARALKAERVRDLPAVPVIFKQAASIAAASSSGSQARTRATSGSSGQDIRPDAASWLAGVMAGDASEPGNALCRQLVTRIGADAACAWFDETHVERRGEKLVVALASKFKAKWVAQNLIGDVVLAARAEWPDLTEADVVIEARGHADAA